MRKALHVVVFVVILGFLLALTPQGKQVLKFFSKVSLKSSSLDAIAPEKRKLNGLIGFWPFDDANAVTTLDDSGNGNPAVYGGTGSLSSVPGKFDKAFNFIGGFFRVGNYYSTGNTTSLSSYLTSSDRTLEAWINPSSVPSDRLPIIDHYDHGIQYQSNKTIGFYINRASGGFVNVSTTRTFEPGTWIHVMAVIKGNDFLKIYVNGKLEANQAIGGVIDASYGSIYPLFIGYSPHLGGFFFQGMMDNVRIYSRALSDAEVVSLATGICGNQFIDAGEQCDVTVGVGSHQVCTDQCMLRTLTYCGDGTQNPLNDERTGGPMNDGVEDCDDGNTNNDDRCSNTCMTPVCGDLKTQGNEQCDLGKDAAGNNLNTDTASCTSICQNAVCGDLKIQTGVEQCDDGNAVDTDSCIACQTAVCGDEKIQAGVEQCDLGKDANGNSLNVDTGACLSTCKSATCGDGKILAGIEDCDDGNTIDTDACLSICQNARCGDGKIQAGVEACDDGNTVNGDECSAACATESTSTSVPKGGWNWGK